MKTCWAYFNGRWIHDRDLRVEIDDLGFSMRVTDPIENFRLEFDFGSAEHATAGYNVVP